MSKLISAILVLSLAFVVHAKPERKAPKVAPKPFVAPVISGECAFGFIIQNGTSISIEGCETWTATGEIHQDGTIRVVWYHVPTAKLAIGIYRVREGGEIRGRWGWESNVTQKDGVLSGSTSGETLRHASEGPIF